MSEDLDRLKQAHVQSVGRALEIIELLARENREMSLTEIAQAMGWPKSTVHGLLATLRTYEYMDQNSQNGCYRLGVRLFELGNVVGRSWNVRAMAVPAMQQLSNTLGEMVQLATEDKGEVLYLEKVDSLRMMRIVSEIGARLPMHCSGLGKVLLAYKKPAEVSWILSKKGLPPMTRRTITDPAKLARELEKIREQGYGVDDQEIMEGLRCVAAPIRDWDGTVRYALSVSGFVGSMQGEHLEDAVRELLAASRKISQDMGYRSQ